MSDLSDSERNLLAARAAGSVIVTAAGVAVGREEAKTPETRRVEAAMRQAAEDALAAGITDPAEIRRHMLAAKDRV